MNLDRKMLASGFSFTATCRGCGEALIVNRYEEPSTDTRRSRTTCVKCGNRYAVTVTMRQLRPGATEEVA